MGILNTLFYRNSWTIGYRKIVDQDTPIPSLNNKADYNLIPLNDHMYYADPFIVEDGEYVYLFAESMNRYRGIGTISVSEFSNGKFRRFQEIIREPFHMSYPNVFKYNDHYYMIPETSASGQVRLYSANNFPYEWELCSVLLENGNRYTDNAIEIIDGKIYLYLFYETDGDKFTEVYILDLDNYSLISKPMNNLIVNERPAGNPIRINNETFRPVQDCNGCYGRAIKLYSHNNSNEQLVGTITEECYNINKKRITGTHTINRSQNFEVIDFKYNRFCLTRRWIWFVNKIKRLFNKTI